MARDHVVMFPEIVEQGIKQKVQAMSPQERKWVLEAMPEEEVEQQNNENRRMHKEGEQAMVAIAEKIKWRDVGLKTGVM